VAVTDEQRIAGYYRLAAANLLSADVPPSTAKKLPRHPMVSAIGMGSLAVGQAHKRQGLDGALLADALHCSARSEIAACAVMVDTKDEGATVFNRHHCFIALPDTTLFLPLATVR
jgi:hypothetical protein